MITASLARRNGLVRNASEVVKQQKSTVAAMSSTNATKKSDGPKINKTISKNGSKDPFPAPAMVAPAVGAKHKELESFWMPFSNNLLTKKTLYCPFSNL